MGTARSGGALTCFCSFTGAGAWGTTDLESLANRLTGASRCGMGIVFTMLTPTVPLLEVGEPKFFLVRLNSPEANNKPTTTPWVIRDPAKAFPNGCLPCESRPVG